MAVTDEERADAYRRLHGALHGDLKPGTRVLIKETHFLSGPRWTKRGRVVALRDEGARVDVLVDATGRTETHLRGNVRLDTEEA